MAMKDDDDKSNEEKNEGSDENFGLPDLELKPLAKSAAKSDGGSVPTSESEQPASTTPTDSYDSYAVDESKSKAPLVLTIVIILVVAIAGYLIYNFVYKPSQEKAKQEAIARQKAAEEKARQQRLAEEEAAAEAKRREAEALANAKPAVGTIEVLNNRTRRYYVIITSDIDDDLLMDYAKKLTTSGINLKVIPPFGGKQFHRLAIADHDTFALAQAGADAAKATYGNGVWVLKY